MRESVGVFIVFFVWKSLPHAVNGCVRPKLAEIAVRRQLVARIF
jgi:hypothetical protein